MATLPATTTTTGLVGELVTTGGLADRAAAVAADQAAPLTRSTYAGVYRAFCAFVGPDAGVDALGRGSVRAYRQSLELGSPC